MGKLLILTIFYSIKNAERRNSELQYPPIWNIDKSMSRNEFLCKYPPPLKIEKDFFFFEFWWFSIISKASGEEAPSVGILASSHI